MNFTAEHQLFRKTVRDFVEHEIEPHVDRWEREGGFPAHELFPKLGALGLLGLATFLFVRNDPRAWPLGPAGFWESMVLPDVLQHRLVVVGAG